MTAPRCRSVPSEDITPRAAPSEPTSSSEGQGALRCRSGLRHVEIVADPIPWWFRKGPAPYREPGPQEPPVLVVLAVNAAGEPLALECPGCRTHHTLDGQPVGRAADIVHLSSSGEFAQAAGRLIASERLNVDGED